MNPEIQRREAVTNEDRAFAHSIIAALMPVRRRNPSLAFVSEATSKARAAAIAAMLPLCGSFTVAEAAAAHQRLFRFANSDHGDKPREDTPQDDCLYWAFYRLSEFARYAPAASVNDAAARARFVAWNEETDGKTEDDALVNICEVIASDFVRLTAGAPIPNEATFAGWCADA